jgi:outer membrane protein assembly factor BamA
MLIFGLTVLAPCIASETSVSFRDGTDRWRKIVIGYVQNHKEYGLADSLRYYLTGEGFLDNDVTLIDGRSSQSVVVSFGPEYNLGKAVLEGDEHDTLRLNMAMTSRNTDAVMDSIIDSYQSLGYYYASARPLSFRKYDSSIDIYVHLTAGPVVTVSAVEFSGIKRTDLDFLRKYAPISTGDTLFPKLIEKSSEVYRKLDFVLIDSSPTAIPDPGYRTARIRYNLQELKSFLFEGAGGYVPGDDDYFLWFLDVKGRNILGSGQRAGLLVDKREKSKSVFRIYYGQPVFLLGTSDVGVILQTRDYRDEFYEFGVNLSYEIGLNSRLSARLKLGWKNVEPADSMSRSFQVYEAGFGINTGEIESLRGAPAGFALDWEINYSGRRYRPGKIAGPVGRSVYNDTRNLLSIEAQLPLLSIISDYNRLDMMDVESSEKPLPPSEMFLFGGPRSLRGYRNDQFSAQRLAIFSSELRLFFSRRDYIYPFIDIAYFEKYVSRADRAVSRQDDIKVGYGVGVNLSSANRGLRIDISWGEKTAFSEPRLSIGFVGRF